MRAEENCALIFKKDCSTKFFQCFSFYSTLSRANIWALFLFLLLVKGEIEGIVSTMIVDLNGISMCHNPDLSHHKIVWIRCCEAKDEPS